MDFYTHTFFNFKGEVLRQKSVRQPANNQAPVRHYRDVGAQLRAELWDLRDSTNPAEALKDRESILNNRRKK